MFQREAEGRSRLLNFAAQLNTVTLDESGSLAERMAKAFPSRAVAGRPGDLRSGPRGRRAYLILHRLTAPPDFGADVVEGDRGRRRRRPPQRQPRVARQRQDRGASVVLAASKKSELVPRPPKKIKYEILFATSDARKVWQDLVATIRNPIVEAWDFLTQTPLSRTPTNRPLRGELGTISRGGTTHQRWQHKPTTKGTARIWYYVHERTVVLEQVHTSHPNETK